MVICTDRTAFFDLTYPTMRNPRAMGAKDSEDKSQSPGQERQKCQLGVHSAASADLANPGGRRLSAS
jgi:hypothetical protein